MLFTSKKKIRYAVVGLGHIAQMAVLPAFKNAATNSELTALVSGDEEKLKKIGAKYRVTKLYSYTQFESCLKNGEVDAVYIATPNYFHRNIMETAARYGVHVLCEKPMAISVEDCHSMIQLASNHHIKLMIAYRLHFDEANLKAIKIAQNKLGQLKIFNSTFTMQVRDPKNIRLDDTKKGGGPLYDIGIYCINAARYLFGAEPVEVFGMSTTSTDPRFKKTDESISVIMKFPDSKLANFCVSFGGSDSADYELIGSKGRLRLENAYEYAAAMTLKYYEGENITTKKFTKHDQFSPELIYFSHCILNNKEPEPSGLEGLADIKIIEAILLSIELRSPVQLDEHINKARPDYHQKISRPSLARPKLRDVTGPSGEKH